ncbi:MAG TPA: type II secretion system F family protein [Gemmatimonadaceae bacterium]|nr:type II secretion system F family protein [Gemmatimonadaceae bacterium]
MPDYFYSALTGSGAVEKGWMTAPSEIVVEEQLRRQGHFLIKAEARARVQKVTDARVDRRELLAFLEYLAGSFTAGVPLLTTLDDVPRRLRSAKLRTIVAEVRHAVSEEGKSLSEALGEHPRAFPQLFVSTIQAGEASGQLAFSLQQLVDYMDWQENISASVRQATMYPLVVLFAISLLVTGLIGFVFPRIIPILKMRNVDLPLPTRIIMSTSIFLRHNLVVLLVLAAVAVIAVVVARRSPRGRMLMDSFVLKVPVIGEFILEVNMARVVTYLSLFYKTGVDLIQSLLLVENMATNAVVAGVVREARERIVGGDTIASAFGRSPLVPVVVMRSLSLGESTGRLDEALDRAKLYYGREIPAAVRRVITLIQPAMIVALGGVILLVALAIMLPILNIYNSIGIRR